MLVSNGHSRIVIGADVADVAVGSGVFVAVCAGVGILVAITGIGVNDGDMLTFGSGRVDAQAVRRITIMKSNIACFTKASFYGYQRKSGEQLRAVIFLGHNHTEPSWASEKTVGENINSSVL